MVIAASQHGLAWPACLPHAPTSAPYFSSNAQRNAYFCCNHTRPCTAIQHAMACLPYPPVGTLDAWCPSKRALLGVQVMRASKP